MMKADLTVAQTATPPMRWCDSGHLAPERMRIEGPEGDLIPTRFFKVSAANQNVSGTYCEACLIVANAMARAKKDR